MAETSALEMLDTIGGASFLAIASELETANRYGVDLANSRIVIARDPVSEFVAFLGKEPEQGTGREVAVRRRLGTVLSGEEARLLLANDRTAILDSVSGSSFLAMRTAEPVFRQRASPDLMQYKISIVRDGDTIVAVFTDRNQQPGTRGTGAGLRPGFEVGMDPADLRVLRAHYIR